MDRIETYTQRVRRLSGGGWSPREQAFPLEVPVAVYVDGSLLFSLSATPTHLEELVLGFLFAEDRIESMTDVRKVDAMADARRGQVWVDLERPADFSGQARITSGCGRGLTFLCVSDLDGIDPVTAGTRIASANLLEAMRTLREGSATYRVTGAIHAACSLHEGSILALAEDIGRHNAVDKVLGMRLRAGAPAAGEMLLTTGRISSEMALKAVKARAPVIASMTGATHLAVEICERLGVTLVTYVRGGSMNVCTHAERVVAGSGNGSRLHAPDECRQENDRHESA